MIKSRIAQTKRKEIEASLIWYKKLRDNVDNRILLIQAALAILDIKLEEAEQE